MRPPGRSMAEKTEHSIRVAGSNVWTTNNVRRIARSYGYDIVQWVNAERGGVLELKVQSRKTGEFLTRWIHRPKFDGKWVWLTQKPEGSVS